MAVHSGLRVHAATDMLTHVYGHTDGRTSLADGINRFVAMATTHVHVVVEQLLRHCIRRPMHETVDDDDVHAEKLVKLLHGNAVSGSGAADNCVGDTRRLFAYEITPTQVVVSGMGAFVHMLRQ